MTLKFGLENEIINNLISEYDSQKKLIKLRKQVNRLYFHEKFSKNYIATHMHLSKHFVIKWTKSPDQDFEYDQRGWPMGKPRKWNNQTYERVMSLYHYLKNDQKAFYWGPTAIQHIWRRFYPQEEVPPVRSIGKMLKDQGLTYQKKQKKGAAKYLCYPEYTVYSKLGNRVMEADFIGQKFLQGQTKPLHFIGFAFKKPPKLRYYQRIEAPTAKSFIRACEKFFQSHERPDCMKVDNAAAHIGSKSGKRNISQVMAFLLEQEIVPIFSVPRRPFTQASIEGNNSVFSRKFWNQRTFATLQDIDTQLEWFNEDSKIYTGYQPPNGAKKEPFIPKVYFLRQVHDKSEMGEEGSIDVLNETVSLPNDFINLFVLAEWNLIKEHLSVYLEKEQSLTLIDKKEFTINPDSKKNLRKTGALSYCI